MLGNVIAVIGPPAAGKSTLTIRLAQAPGRRVFRLRDHVPVPVLAANAADAQRQGWIDDFTVITSIHGYIESVIGEGAIHTLLLDNFPGTGTQVRLFLSVLRQLNPSCTVRAIELLASQTILQRRASTRRVCPYCERDPLCDPRLPAEASLNDPGRCARCDHLLETRRGDEPEAYQARMARYQKLADGVRQAFANAGIDVMQLDSSRPLAQTASEFSQLMATRSTPL